MPVVLCTSRTLPERAAYDAWCAVPGTRCAARAEDRLPDAAALVEAAYDAIRDEWFALGRSMAADATAVLAHTPTAAGNISDFGLMLAWARLVRQLEADPRRLAVVCDDPWLFRHLAGICPTVRGPAPGLLLCRAKLRARGLLARTKAALTVLGAWLRHRASRARFPDGARTLLAYAHPASTADGDDAYFGTLMREIPATVRLLHTDGTGAVARRLCGDARTFSLHAWGDPLLALRLPFSRWRPSADLRHGAHGWLVRRAEAREGSTGQGAMLRWQSACQRRWLEETRPSVIAWPWENHAWERALVRAARRLGRRTVGYQHTPVARREWNFSAHSSPDGAAAAPDTVLCSGAVARRQLTAMGYADAGLRIAGAFRRPRVVALDHDPDGDVFVALPFDRDVAREMLAAIRPLGRRGWTFRVKDHPMTPTPFEESEGVRRAGDPLSRQGALRAVLYCATTVGLEAALGGLPTLRFVPGDVVPTDVFPEEVAIPAAAAAALEAALQSLGPPPAVSEADFFAAPDLDVWRATLE